MTRRFLWIVLVALVPVAVFVAMRGEDASSTRDAGPQAVLVFVWPGVAPESLAVYGGEEGARLVALERLVQNGWIAERYVPSSESSAAALATLMTGLAPDAHGLASLRTPGRQRLASKIPTLAGAFGSRGWRTLVCIRPEHLADEVTGLARGFDERFEEYSPWLSQLTGALAEGKSVFGVFCERAIPLQPSSRGQLAASSVRRALVNAVRPEVQALRERLRSGTDAETDAALDELDALLLRRRGDPERDLLLRGYRDAELTMLDGLVGHTVKLLEQSQWTIIVCGLDAPALDGGTDELRVPLIVGSRHGEAEAPVQGLTSDLDLAAALRSVEGWGDGLREEFERASAERTSVVVHGAGLIDAAVWRDEGWAREPGPCGVLALRSRGLEGTEVVVRALDGAPTLHGGGPGSARVVVRLGLDGDSPSFVRSERRAPALVVRLPVAEEKRVRVGGKRLDESDAVLLPSAAADAWPSEVEHAVRVRELSGGRFALDAGGRAARWVVEAVGVDDYATVEVLGVPSEAHPRRPLARVVEGARAFECVVSSGASLALAVFVEGERVPAAQMRYGERRFSSGALELALSAWAWSDVELLGKAVAFEGGVSVELSDPPPVGGEVHVVEARHRVWIERLGADE